MTDRIRRLIDHHFAEHNNAGMSSRTIQRIVKEVANRAGISKLVTPMSFAIPFQSIASKGSPLGL